FVFGAAGLPAGLTLNGNIVSGVPTPAGSFTATLTATDAAHTASTVQVTLTISPAPASYTIPDESKGKISALRSGYIMDVTKMLIWNAYTTINLNTPDGERHVVDNFVQVGMKVQWKDLRDKASNTVLTSQLEIN